MNAAERISLATEIDRSSLNELDYLLCRNVEVYCANEEDVQGNTQHEGSCENVVVGQVGLRCIHCSLSPFATAKYATIFPMSIIHIGADLRMMAKWHFSRCSMSPSKLRKEMERVLSVIETKDRREKRYDSMRSLNDFCSSVVAKRFNLQNTHPYNNGIIFSNSRKESTSQPPIGESYSNFGSEYVAGSSAPYHNSQQFIAHRQRVTSPTQHRTHPSLPSPQSAQMVPRYMHIPQSHQAPYAPVGHQSNFALSQLDHSQNFCSSVPFQFRAPNSFYPYVNPPPPLFIDYNLQRCNGTRFYQQSIPDTFSHQGTLNLDEALDYLTSVSNFESPLILEEDRILLSDYFFYLMKQLLLCHFAEPDRKIRGGKRDKVKIGYGGLECRHCAMKAHPLSSRKFFWSNVDRLANSFAEIPNHILNCKNCPDRVKKSLHVLKAEHSEQMARLPRGSQKVFFRRMWRRVHKDSPTEKEMKQTIRDEPTSDATSTAIPKPPPLRVFLAIPEDKDWLSDTDCFIRRHLEVFCASHDDIISAQNESEYPITLGQVGIRCIHCASTSEGASGNAVNFPFTINRIYEAVRAMQTLHLEHCNNLPADVSQEMATLKASTSSLSSVSKRYYVLAAKELGMIDTPEGIQMGREKLQITSTGSFTFKDNHDKAADESSSSTNDINERKEGKTSRKRKSSPLTEDNKDCKKQNTS